MAKLSIRNYSSEIGNLISRNGKGFLSISPFSAFSLAVLVLLAVSVSLPASTSAAPAEQSGEVRIPKPSDWVKRGKVLSAGPAGSWDARISGSITPATVVELNGVFYLYYIGADGNRSTDGGPRHRALGVATSTDGIHFSKYSGNPVIKHLPHDNEEEGVFSAGATVAGGKVILFYGAMNAGNSTSESVDSDIRLAVSSDGLKFTDKGDVVSHSGGSVWGGGDEMFPVGVHQGNGTTNVYYIAKGSGADWDLGLASGPATDQLPNTGPALTSGSQIRGGSDPALLAPDTLGFFIVRGSSAPRSIEVWTAPVSKPGKLSGPVETYKFGDVNNATVTLGKSVNTWFMYYLNADKSGILVRTAPAVGGDTTPPSTPTSLRASTVGPTQIRLDWSAASDAESGVTGYKVYRNGKVVGSPNGTGFSDSGLTQGSSYEYQVSAINGAGREGSKSKTVVGRTEAGTPPPTGDTTPPTIVRVAASGDPKTVKVVFSETVEKASATRIGNYSINRGITLASAALGTDLKTVTLRTSAHSESVAYTLTVKNVRDRATEPNTIADNSQVGYKFEDKTIISNLKAASGKPYQVVSGPEIGDPVYIDRSYSFTSIPAVLKGKTHVQTANNDKSRTEATFLTFTANQDVTVYVAYDARASSIPNWLTGWADTGQTLKNTDVNLDLYSKGFAAGKITLGANLAKGAAGSFSNYTVIIMGADSPPPAQSDLDLSNLRVASDRPYQVVEGLQVGDSVYIDRSYKYTSVPSLVRGAMFLRTANVDKARKETSFLTFSVNQKVTVYVAYDFRATTLPDWLAGWSDAGRSLKNDDGSLKLYAKDFGVGTVVLGGNLARGAAGASSNYTVAIVPR